MEKASGKNLKYEIVARRPGDVAECYANCSKANSVLGWKAEFGIDEMCKSSWIWQKQNPTGFSEK